MTPANRTGSVIPPTFDSTSSDYHKKLHEKGYISEAQLNAAESGDKAAILEANNDVYQWEMFQSSRKLTQKQSEAIDPYSLASQRKRDEKLEAHYKTEGYDFKKIKSTNHNCLITAILQHLTGDYNSAHDDKAQHYRDKLNDHLKKNLNADQKKRFLDNDLLVADHLNWLLPEMANDTDLKIKNPTVEIWVAADEGRLMSFPIGSGKEKFIIFSRTDHFEAVIPPVQKKSLTPLSTPALSNPTTNAAPVSASAAIPSGMTTANSASVKSSTDNSLNKTSDSKKNAEKDKFSFEETDLNFFDDKTFPITFGNSNPFIDDDTDS